MLTKTGKPDIGEQKKLQQLRGSLIQERIKDRMTLMDNEKMTWSICWHFPKEQNNNFSSNPAYWHEKEHI